MTSQQKPYSVDLLMWNTLSKLLSDFSSPRFPSHLSRLLTDIISRRDVLGLRALDFDHYYETDKHTFKCVYQVLSIAKRHIFNEDVLSASDLQLAGVTQFVSNQERLSQWNYRIDKHIEPVVFAMKGICHDILGEFDRDEFISSCRMGKRAAVGVPARRARESSKWCLPISGSADHIQWFVREYLAYHRLAAEYCGLDSREQFSSRTTECDSLKLTFVPKSFKSLRSIMPNTVIGALRSDGLGKCISNRLKRYGLDIETLQSQHRDLAKIASSTGDLVTCDQSLASDNITREFCQMILPRVWFEELDLGRIDKIDLPDGSQQHLAAFCTMGIGFTFPLQTLVFYSFVRALDIVYFDGTSLITCYGDDLIFDKKLWPFFKTIAPKFGFLINEAKSFAEGWFKESCGGDFYRGLDVRPFQPKWTEASHVDKTTYEMLLYRFFNGLRRRWADIDISSTLSFLAHELNLLTDGDVKIVPSDFGDICGVKVSRLTESDELNLAHRPLVRNRNGAVIFRYLCYQQRYERDHFIDPYYWLSLLRPPSECPYGTDRIPAPIRYRESGRRNKLLPFTPIPGVERAHCQRTVTVLL